MFGCLVGLTISIVTAFILAVAGLLRFVLILMVTTVSSLFIGFDTAVDRISEAWIEQSTGNGINIGYNQAGRDGMRVGAAIMLVVGWIVTIGVVWWIVSAIVN